MSSATRRGIGLIHALARRLGLIDAIDQRLELLKFHLPYHESDHVTLFTDGSLLTVQDTAVDSLTGSIIVPLG